MNAMNYSYEYFQYSLFECIASYLLNNFEPFKYSCSYTMYFKFLQKCFAICCINILWRVDKDLTCISTCFQSFHKFGRLIVW